MDAVILKDVALSDLLSIIHHTPPSPRPRKRRSRRRQHHRLTPVILMAQTVYQDIINHLATKPPEAGGVLIGPRDHRSVSHYVPDDTGTSSPTSFTFDHKRLNEILRDYVRLGLDAKGFVHSHPPGVHRLSSGDHAFIRTQLSNPKNTPGEILMPIVVGREIIPYIVYADQPQRSVEAELRLF